MLKDNSQILSWLKFLIGWPLSFISIFFILKLIFDKSGELEISPSEINFTYLILGVLTFLVFFLMWSFRWWLEIRERGYQLNFRESTYRFSFSQLKRYTPGNIWAFLSLGEQFVRLGVDRRTIAISILGDIQLVVIGCGIVSILSIPWLLKSGELQSKLLGLLPVSIIAIMIFFIATGIFYAKRYNTSSLRRAKVFIISNIFLPGFKLDSKIKLSAVSVLTYFIFGIANYLVFASIFPTNILSFLTLSSFFVFSLLIGYLSFITPMGLGVRELVITLGLSQIMSAQDAGVISIFERLIMIISELLFLSLVFLWKHFSKK